MKGISTILAVIACMLLMLLPAVRADQGGIIGALAQVDTNASTTATGYTPRRSGDILLGGSSAQYDSLWVSKGTTTNDWVKLSTYAQAQSIAQVSAGVTGSSTLIFPYGSWKTNSVVYLDGSSNVTTNTITYFDPTANLVTNTFVFNQGVCTNQP